MKYLIIFLSLFLCVNVYGQITPIASPTVDNSLSTSSQQYLNTLYNAIKTLQGNPSNYVIGITTNSANYVPQWNGANSNTLMNGLQVGTATNNLVQLDATDKLPAVDGSQLTNLPTSQTWTNVSVLTGSGTFHKPTNINYLYIEAWGGGGGCAFGNTNGAGGGGYVTKLYHITGNVNYQVGQGGTPIAGATDSTFDTIDAGAGGTGTGSAGSGGAASGGDMNIVGQSGYAIAPNPWGGGSPRGGMPTNGINGNFPGGGASQYNGGSNSGANGSIIIRY